MTLSIRIAETEADLRAAFELRHRVFVGEEILDLDRPDGLLYDVFDTLPTSITIVAEKAREIVGTVRVTLHGDHQHPCDGWFEWRSLVPDARIASGSMLCTIPGRRSGMVGLQLLDAAMELAVVHGGSHAVAPIRPEAERLFGRLGWSRFGQTFDHPVERVPVVPMLVDFAQWAVITKRPAPEFVS